MYLLMQYTPLLLLHRWGQTLSSYRVWLKHEIGCLKYHCLRIQTYEYITQRRTE